MLGMLRLTARDGDEIVVLADLDVRAGLNAKTRDGGAPGPTSAKYPITRRPDDPTHFEPMILGNAERGRPVRRPTAAD